MYFLSNDERKKLLRYYLPKSREQGVADELRGWNWHQPPLEPIYDICLPIYQIAGKYCDSGRDVYLNRVEQKKGIANTAMKRGAIFHELIVKTMVTAKKLIYNHNVRVENIMRELDELLPAFLEKNMDVNTYIPEFQEQANQIFKYMLSMISSRLQETLTRQPYIGEDALVAQVIPYVLEQKLDGTFLGLSPNLSSDAFVFSEPMVMDMKFGPRESFHCLTTTGYALAMEAVFEYPINVGCIVYGEFRNGRLNITKHFHIINDEVRQWFIEERDEKTKMVYDGIDPGKADNCSKTCPYYACCF